MLHPRRASPPNSLVPFASCEFSPRNWARDDTLPLDEEIRWCRCLWHDENCRCRPGTESAPKKSKISIDKKRLKYKTDGEKIVWLQHVKEVPTGFPLVTVFPVSEDDFNRYLNYGNQLWESGTEKTAGCSRVIRVVPSPLPRRPRISVGIQFLPPPLPPPVMGATTEEFPPLLTARPTDAASCSTAPSAAAAPAPAGPPRLVMFSIMRVLACKSSVTPR